MNERELVTALYEALATGDAERLDNLLHNDFRGQVADGMPFGMGGEHKGIAAMRDEVWWTIGKHYAAQAVATTMTPDDEGRLVVSADMSAPRVRLSKPLDAAFVHIFEFADGRIHTLTQVTDTERWHEAVRPEPRSSYVTCEVSDGLATLTLNRVDADNAINQDLVDDFHDAVMPLASVPGLRAVLIRANGPVFTPGGDIKLFASVPPEALTETILPMVQPYHVALLQLSKLAVPVVAAVHGSVAGGGLGIALVADVVLAAEGTKFATGFSKIGLTGDGGCAFFLPRLIGVRRAFEMYYDNRVLDAAEALDWGLISRVVPSEALESAAEQYARRLASGPTLAFAEMRAHIRRSATATFEEQLSAELEGLRRSTRTSDAVGAIASFVAKQRPVFHGR